MTAANSHWASIVADGMARFREEMENNDRLSLAIALKTKKIVKFMGLLVAVAIIVVIFQIFSMRSELMVMVLNLEEMYKQFQFMSVNLDTMTNQVQSIRERVADLPLIVTDMSSINADVALMQRAIGGMTKDVTAMTLNTTVLRDATGEMAFHFHQVQQTVGHLNYNVEEMMRPLSIFPR